VEEEVAAEHDERRHGDGKDGREVQVSLLALDVGTVDRVSLAAVSLPGNATLGRRS
jgi:hypothetical protein